MAISDKILVVVLIALPCLVSADPGMPTMPSDAEIQQKMAEQRQAFDAGLAKTQNLPVKPIVPAANGLNPPDFMTQHGFGGLARDAQIAASQIQSPTHNRRSLMLALTLSMPEPVLREYAKQAEESGARIILRGVPNGTTVPQVAAIVARINHGAKAEWSIDPPLFRRFKLDKVPALVLVDDEAAQKLENECAPETSFLEVDGEVSIRQGLSIMALDKSKLGVVAANKLQAIENRGESQ